jgi:hypothetical protein
LQEFVFKSDDRQYKYKAEDQAKRNYYYLRQTPEMSCQEYFERVRSVVDVIKSLGGSVVDDMHLKDELPEREPRNGYTEEQLTAARKRIQDKTVAYGILVRADRSRFGKLIEEIENDFLKGNNDYPVTPTEAYNLLVNYRSYNNNKRTAGQGGLDHVAFLSDGKRQKQEGESRYFPHIKCFKCNQFGHNKSDCPVRNKENGSGGNVNDNERQEQVQVTLTTMHVTLAVAKQEIDPMWILCDSESTIDVFRNKSLLANIRKTSKPIRLKGIEGQTIEIEEEGDLLGYGPVYYHQQVTANVLSLYNMARRFQSIVYNNKTRDAFLLTHDDGTIMEFVPSASGLYYYDFNISVTRHKDKSLQNTMMVETVEKLRRNYTARELKQMDDAQRLYVIMGRPSKADFLQMIKKGKLLENPVQM